MNEFEYLTTRHEHLKKKVEEGENTVIYVYAEPGTNALVGESNDYRSENVRAEIRSLIMDVRQLSGATIDPFDRSKLKGILDYWNDYIATKTKKSPNFDILPAPEIRPLEKFVLRGMLLMAGTVSATVVMVVYIFMAAFYYMPVSGAPTPTPNLAPEPTPPFPVRGTDPIAFPLAPALLVMIMVAVVIILAVAGAVLFNRLQQTKKAQQANKDKQQIAASRHLEQESAVPQNGKQLQNPCEATQPQRIRTRASADQPAKEIIDIKS